MFKQKFYCSNFVCKQCLPEFEVGIVHSVGESLSANTDTFQHTVTGQLVHYQVGINKTWSFGFVGDDTTDEMGLSGSQSGHQVVQLFLVGRRYSGETTSLLTTSLVVFAAATTRLSWMIGEDFHQQFVGGFLELVDNGVVQRILVLFQPTADVVWYLQTSLF